MSCSCKHTVGKAGERGKELRQRFQDGVQEFSPFKRNEEYQSILSKGRVSRL